MRILTVGPLWRGSNAGGLFRALSRKGCLIDVVDEFYYVSLKTRNTVTKVLERLIRPRQAEEFNNAIKERILTFKPDVLFVYKGLFVAPSTLDFARENNCKLAMFYPDISVTVHGNNIIQSIPKYDVIFTTKTFGIKDMEKKYGSMNSVFVPHGFDPEIHRPLEFGKKERDIFSCDVSFIGTYSPKKEKWLSYVKEQLPDINLKIWGDQWFKMTESNLKESVQGMPIFGDLYAIGIQCSKINLGILLERVPGASSGDRITSRTFHIPGAAGFMLHERNEESVLYFDEDKEAGFFDGPEELVQKIRFFLENETQRETIRQAGYARVCRDHSLDKRAETVISHLNSVLSKDN